MPAPEGGVWRGWEVTLAASVLAATAGCGPHALLPGELPKAWVICPAQQGRAQYKPGCEGPHGALAARPT